MGAVVGGNLPQKGILGKSHTFWQIDNKHYLFIYLTSVLAKAHAPV